MTTTGPTTTRPGFHPDSPCVGAIYPAVNIEPRLGDGVPRLLILHYTGMHCARKAVQWLACAESRVSCHYVVDELGLVTQLVPERLRAWHAGVSAWEGVTDINSASIGIEIQNPGHEDGYPDFTDPQIAAVIELSSDICRRNQIDPWHVLAHSDIAPHRKIDPGEKFPWSVLAAGGVGLWVEPTPIDPHDTGFEPGYRGETILQLQSLLADFGYGIPLTGALDPETCSVVRAFQRHHRPLRVDGRVDASTVMTARRLSAARANAQRAT